MNDSVAAQAEWTKLSPWSVLHFAARRVAQNLQAAYVLVPAIFGASLTGLSTFAWTLPAFIVGLVLTSAVLSYRMFSYRILESSVQVKQGLFIRKQLDLPVERIQNVNFEDPFYFRPLGLVTIKIDGAGATSEEVYLAALTLQRAELIRRDIIIKKRAASPGAGTEAAEAPEEESTPAAGEQAFFSRSLTDLVVYGLTNNRAFLVIGGFFAFLSQTPFSLDGLVRSIGIDLGSMLAAQSLARLVLLLLISFLLVMAVMALLSVLASIATYYRFTIYRTEDALTVRRGLFTRHETHIRKSRIQVISYWQDWLDFVLGRRNVVLEQISHGAAAGGGAQQGKKTMIPSVALEDTAVLIDEILPGVRVDDLAFTAISKRYFYKHAIINTMLYALAGIAPFVSDLEIADYLPLLLLLLPFHITYLYMRWKRAGLAVYAGVVVARSGTIGIQYRMFPAYKIQKAAHVQSLLMKRRNLSNVSFNTAASAITVPYLDTAFAKQVVDYCLYRSESDRRSWM